MRSVGEASLEVQQRAIPRVFGVVIVRHAPGARAGVGRGDEPTARNASALKAIDGRIGDGLPVHGAYGARVGMSDTSRGWRTSAQSPSFCHVGVCAPTERGPCVGLPRGFV